MPTHLKHLLLATVEDPFNVKSWSGIPYSLREALARKVERLSVFRPGKPSRNPLDLAKRFWYGGKPPKYPLWMTNSTLKKNARELKACIEETNPDAVLSISSQCIVRLPQQSKPVFLFSDAPWMAWHEAYKGTISAPAHLNWYAELEAAAAHRLDGLCFGSEWAVEEAARLYRGNDRLRERLHVTPLGANWVPRVSREEVLRKAAQRSTHELELLYVGKDWERKGGPLAVEVAGLLHASGQRVRLHIVGCRPHLPNEAASYATVHGLLYQSDPEQSSFLAELFERSHFLIVPSFAECFGIVFAEAQAFGLPPISRRVHALPTVVRDGETGLLLNPAAKASEYVERILKLLSDPPAYRKMAEQARERFENCLNWDKTAETIVGLIDDRLGESRRF